jgi:drug efflux transport system permease protein
MKTIKHIIIKEFLQIKRDKKLFRIVFIAPIIQLLFLGYAANLDLDNIKISVLDHDKSAVSREFIESFESSGYFTVYSYSQSYDQVNEEINQGDILLAVIIPDDFEKNIGRHETSPLQLIFDGSDGNKTSIALGYVQGIVTKFSKDILLKTADKSGRKISIAGTIQPEIRVWYNPELKTRNFMVPSIAGLILLVITTILMAMAIVKEREIGTLEQIIVTPIKPYQLIIGKLIPFVIFGFIDILLVNAVMVFWFGIAIKGSFIFLLFASSLFVLSTLGLGLFISTISKTQQQAMMIAQFGILLPMIYLSGFAFPIENMPQWIQYITYLIPLRYFITILRDIVLKGSGFMQLIPETIILFLMGVSILFFSSLRFKKRLE